MPVALLIGNSDGIGLALTRLLLERGWQVAGVSRSASPIDSPAYGHTIADVRDPEYPARLRALVSELPDLTLCVYCAGVGAFLELDSMSQERAVFETNLIGAVATAQVVIPELVRAGHGHFIGLSSQADVLIDKRAPSYAASKAGLSSYLEGLALACRPQGVAVTNLRFGFVNTKLAKASLRPFMLTPEQAARRIESCLRRRPIRDTYPKRTALLVWLLRLGSRVKRRLLLQG
jgi:NAD(P)-dependent dehydrogenase (short-subunit alcohol dehydrogenase family)